MRIRRHGSEILLSEGPNAREFLAGKLMAEELNTFALADNTVIFLTFDHEIRYVKQLVNNKTFVRRHYSASVKIFDHTLSNMTAYLADVIQPKTIYERGFASGIIDLQHVYPMGWALTTLKGKAQVRVYAGASDAHTALYSFDVVKLLRELKI